MEMEDAIRFLTLEADRLESIGLPRSSYTFSTLTESGRVARLILVVDIENPEETAKKMQQQQQSQVPPPARPPQPQQQQPGMGMGRPPQ